MIETDRDFPSKFKIGVVLEDIVTIIHGNVTDIHKVLIEDGYYKNGYKFYTSDLFTLDSLPTTGHSGKTHEQRHLFRFTWTLCPTLCPLFPSATTTTTLPMLMNEAQEQLYAKPHRPMIMPFQLYSITPITTSPTTPIPSLITTHHPMSQSRSPAFPPFPPKQTRPFPPHPR